MVDLVNRSLGEALGEELGPDLIALTDHANSSALLTLKEAYDEYRASWRVPVRPHAGSLSPYLPTYSTMGEPGGVVLRMEYDFLDLEKIDRSVEALHLQLLYAHRVAMTESVHLHP